MSLKGVLWMGSIIAGSIGVFWGFGGFPTEIAPAVEPTKAKDNQVLNYRQSPMFGSQFLTDEEITYKPDGALYLVIIGHVFDVRKQLKSYGPGTGYHGFIGRDGSKAFISGDFTDAGLTSDLNGLTSKDFEGLGDWLDFYFKTYPFVGYHIGRFFDMNGKATPEYVKFLEMQDVAKQDAEERHAVNKEFPPCNVEWSEAKGTNVWCSDKSGGIDRDWTGVPVLFKESPDKEMRCACVRKSQLNDPRISKYKGCADGSTRCNKVSQ